jgi:predicted AAA+ superfamily ATPase
VREDLRDLSRLPDLSRIEMLVALLPERAGGPLSVQSLREDLEVGHHTVTRWLNYLAELYYLFEVKPWARAIPRALRREGKLYLWDWTEVTEPGHRFENMVACHLLKACHYWTDTGEGQFDLHYVRDKQKREVDFLISRDRKPWLAIECKLSADRLAPGLASFLPKLGGIPFLQLVGASTTRRRVEIGESIGRVMTASEFLVLLP